MLDRKNDNGDAQLIAAWTYPLVFVPTEMSGRGGGRQHFTVARMRAPSVVRKRTGWRGR